MNFNFTVAIILLICSCLYERCSCALKTEAVIDCIKQYPTEQNILEFMINGQLPDESEKNAKCLFNCVAVKTGFIVDNKIPTADKVMGYFMEQHQHYIDDGSFETNVTGCIQDVIEISDNCDRAYELSKCLMKLYLNFLDKQ